MIKEKLRNCLLTVILSILFIASMFAIIGLSSCNVKKTILSNDINIQNDNLNLKKDYHLDSNGNIVSDNLFDVNNVSNGGFDGNYPVIEYSIVNNGIYISNSGDLVYNRVNNLVFLSRGTYSLSCGFSGSTGRIVACYVSNDVEEIIFDINNISSNVSYTFTLDSSLNVYFYFYCINRYSSCSFSNIMLNSGSSVLPFEPFGTWYPHSAKQNFLNGFYGWEFYTHSSSATPSYSDFTGNGYFNVINDINYLGLNPYPWPNQYYNDSYMHFYYNDLITLNPFTYFYVWSFGMEFTFKFYNGNTLVYTIDSTNSDRSSFVYTFDSEYQFDSFIFISKDGVWEEDTPMCCLSYAETITSYNEGVKAGQQQSYETINNLNAAIEEKNNTISDLQFTIRELNERLNTNINSLFYTMISSVMSTPFNILHDYLNWNFFGINLFSLFTSLVTLLIILWVVKFLLGRK